MKKFGRIIVASVLASSMIVSTVCAEPSVSEIQEKIDVAEAEVNDLQDQLQDLFGKIGQLEEDLIQKGEEISQAQADLEVAQKKEEKQYYDMKLRIKFMYEEGNTSYINALLSAESFSDLLNKAEYVQSIHTYDRNMLTEYVNTKNQIAEMKEQLEAQQAEMQALQEEYGRQEDTLNTLLNEKQAEVADLEVELQIAAEAERKRQEEEARRKAEEEAAAAAAAAASSSGGGSYSGGGSSSNYVPSGYGSGGAIVSAAYGFIGVPYVWGGTSYSGVDCSGLVYLAHRACGISVSRTSGALGGGGMAVSASEAQPGDVVCYSGHVGIYIGGGQMIHAPQPGYSVCVANVNYASHWFRRYW